MVTEFAVHVCLDLRRVAASTKKTLACVGLYTFPSSSSPASTPAILWIGMALKLSNG